MFQNRRNEMGMYIHIPFCVQKCAYCDFLSAPASRQTQESYLEALKKELVFEAAQYSNRVVQSIFLGGGTPSVLTAADIASVLNCINTAYHLAKDAEITMELNPGTAVPEKLACLRRAGVNRLSIGLQTASNKELKLLGRIHTFEDFLQTYTWARTAGFDNINIDLMSALPGQSLAGWEETLLKVLALKPEHISAYSLIIEEGTHLFNHLEEYPDVPDENTDRQMYQETKRILAANGLKRYEISNYAREGYACRHNRIYWQRGVRHVTDYAGYGLGASSTVGTTRWQNTVNMKQYLGITASQGARTQIQQLSLSECIEEFMFLGLRMMSGVSEQEFWESFGVKMDAVYREVIYKWVQRGMLEQIDGFVRLTDSGIDVSNVVLADFLLDSKEGFWG